MRRGLLERHGAGLVAEVGSWRWHGRVRDGHGAGKEERLTGGPNTSAGRDAVRQFGWAGRLAGPLLCGAEGSEAVLGFGPSGKERDGPRKLGRRGGNGPRAQKQANKATRKGRKGNSFFLFKNFQSKSQNQF